MSAPGSSNTGRRARAHSHPSGTQGPRARTSPQQNSQRLEKILGLALARHTLTASTAMELYGHGPSTSSSGPWDPPPFDPLLPSVPSSLPFPPPFDPSSSPLFPPPSAPREAPGPRPGRDAVPCDAPGTSGRADLKLREAAAPR